MFAKGRLRLRIALHVAAVAGFSAVALPAPASAEDGTEPLSPPSAELATVADADSALEDVVAAVVDQAEEELGSAVATTDDAGASISTGAEDSQEEDGPEDADPPPPQDDAASTNGSEPDTTPAAGDTDVDTSAPATTEEPDAPSETSPATTPAAAAPATPPAAVNLNVTVRIDSPGDNGAVTQANTTTPASGAGAASRSTPGPKTATPTAAPTAPSPADSESSTWYWQWDCLSMPTIPVVSPSGSTDQSLPTSWTWIWNCANNLPQYQSDSSEQYQQINNNISIRISSPGANGAVTQTNVLGSKDARPPAGSPRIPAPGVATPVISLPTITVTVPTVAISIPPIAVGLPTALAGSLESAGESPLSAAAGVAITIDASLGIAVVGDAPDPAEIVVPRLGDIGVARHPGGLDFHPVAPVHPPLGVSVAGSSVSPATHGGAAPLSATERAHRPVEQGTSRRAKPAARWTPIDAATDGGVPHFAPAGATASAAGAGGSPGGGLPIFLALPFLAVVLDLARRVALERATWPSGYRRRIPDTPG